MNDIVDEGLQFSDEMRMAWEFVENTKLSVFLTGKAGTGKTTFLRYVRSHTSKTCVVTAPTGVAAINAGGITLHSLFQLPLSPYVPGSAIKTNYRFSKQKLRLIRSLDLLIIDEVSMVRSDLLDAVDSTLRRLRGSVEPFGGVQLLLIGDLQQLAPVVRNADQELLQDNYSTPYFFGSKALGGLNYVTIGLKQVFRQQDPEFIRLLNNVRSNALTASDRRTLALLCRPDFQPRDDEGYIRLTTHNRLADGHNQQCLAMLNGREFSFSASVNGDFPESSYPTEGRLVLKMGAQVMFIKNDSSADGRFYNGKIGHVIEIDDRHVRVRCQDDGIEVEVEPMAWENTTFEIDEESNTITSRVVGTFSQLPLRLAWAITIHKSQGLTFNHAIIDAGQAFAPGQVYVALSRCRSLSGVVLITPLNYSRMLTDVIVTDFIRSQVRETNQYVMHIEALKSQYRRALLTELFSFTEIGRSLHLLRKFAGEHLGKGGVAIARVLEDTEGDMQESITNVAHKWVQSLSACSDEMLDSETLRGRMESSLSYFLEHLERDILEPLQVLKQVKPGNKVNARRWNELYEGFITAAKSKRIILDSLAGHPFSTTRYLDVRRKALLESSKEPLTKTQKSRKKTLSKKS